MKKLTLILSAFLLAISLSAQERVHAVTDAGITFKVQGKGGTYTKPLPERVTIAEDAKTEWDGETLTLTVTTPQVDENEEPTDPLVVEYVITEQEIADAWAYVPTPEPVIGEWTSLEFFSRFTQSEQIAIETSTAIVAYDIEVGSTGTAYYFMVDGVAVAIDAVSSGVDNGNWFGDMINQTDNVVVGGLIRSSNNGYASGVVNNVVVKNAVGTEVLNWAGDGNANVNWEDDAGSFDGTINGSPALYTGQDVNGFVNHDYTGIGTSRGGAELIGSLDFTSDWTTTNTSVIDADTFTTNGAVNARVNLISVFEVGKSYRVTMVSSVTAGTLNFSSGGIILVDSGIAEFTATTANLAIGNDSASTNDVTVLKIVELGTNDTSQTTAADRPKIVQAGSLITDGNGNTSILFEATDDLDFDNAFTGLTAASIYAVTDNAGTVTLDTLTAQDITAVTTMNGLLTSLTYDKVTAVFIAIDNTNEALIQARLNSIYGTWPGYW